MMRHQLKELVASWRYGRRGVVGIVEFTQSVRKHRGVVEAVEPNWSWSREAGELARVKRLSVGTCGRQAAWTTTGTRGTTAATDSSAEDSSRGAVSAGARWIQDLEKASGCEGAVGCKYVSGLGAGWEA